jgi:MraZ protein
MFSGSNKLTIDDKGRLAIPARVRTQLSDEYGKQIAVTLGPECIEIFPAAVFRRIAEAIPKIADRNKRVLMMRMFVGNAVESELDAQGRVVVPPLLRERMKIALGSEVMLVGQFDRFELWPEAAWNASTDAGQASYADAYAALTDL